MGQYKNIFAVVEGVDDSTPAMRRAVALARASGAHLHFCGLLAPAAVNLVGHLSHTLRDVVKANMLSVRRDWLEEYMIGLREQGIEVSGEILWQEPDEENLVMRALNLRPDLVIKDAQHTGAIRPGFLSTVDQNLLRCCPYPLMIVAADAPALPSRVLAAVDPAHSWHAARQLNERVLGAALGVALQADARLSVASVIEAPPAQSKAERSRDPRSTDEIYQEHRQDHQERLHRLTVQQGIPPDRSKVLYGEPASSLADYVAETGTDLLVIGTLYRGPIDHLFLGSTAKRLASAMPCDILAVKPEGFDQDFVAIHGMHALSEPVHDDNLAAALGRDPAGS